MFGNEITNGVYIATGLCLSSSFIGTSIFSIEREVKKFAFCVGRERGTRSRAVEQQEVSPPW